MLNSDCGIAEGLRPGGGGDRCGGVASGRGPRLFQLVGERLKVRARFEPHLAEYAEGFERLQVADNGYLYYPVYFPALAHPWAKGLGWPNVGFFVFTSDMRRIATYEVPVQPWDGDPWLCPQDCTMGADNMGFVYGVTREPVAPGPGRVLAYAYNPRTRAYFRFQVSYDSWCGMRLGHDGAWYILTTNWLDRSIQRSLRVYRYDVSDLRAAAPDVTTRWRKHAPGGGG